MDNRRRTYALVVLFAINTMNFFDRQVLGVVAEPIRREWGLSDTTIGALGTAFTLLYALVGLPFGRLTDRATRTRILSAGVLVWSVLTAASGLCRTFWQLFAARLGVGVGEASCAPAASSLIGDLYRATGRARAMSVFMMGLPVGVALSYGVGGAIARHYGWRPTFYVAGVPGLLCALAVLFVREPARGAAEAHRVGARTRLGSPYALVLSMPTMWWIIASGALHNFNMYAIAAFLSPFLMRAHGLDVRDAGFASMVIFGLAGIPGLLVGGMAGDAIMKRRRDGRLLVGAVAILGSVPFTFLALRQPPGEAMAFSVLMAIGCAIMYSYYSLVYPTIHDLVEPSLRGTAMSLYFLAMYLLGASLGPVGTGFVSDFFTHRAAAAAGVLAVSPSALEPFRAQGLHAAMYLIPALGVGLMLVLWAGSRTVAPDMDKLQKWATTLEPTEQ